MQTKIMGILNTTPDSFSDGGHFVDAELAIAHGNQLFEDGADVVDVGGESTRPGAQPVSPSEEIDRVVPVIEGLHGQGRISIDTRHEEVARAAIIAGATLINDLSSSLYLVAAEMKVGWIAIHMQGTPSTMQKNPHYEDVVGEVQEFLSSQMELANKAQVDEVYIDPGIGFGKMLEHNRQILSQIDSFTTIGPVVVGASRKSCLGTWIASARPGGATEPPASRDLATIATSIHCLTKNVAFVRVHNVAATKDAFTVWREITSK